MALNNEDKKDVAKHLGKALANKVSKVTRDKKKKSTFIERLEAHKREGASFDNGTWKPSKKGETFIQALERHKSQREFD